MMIPGQWRLRGFMLVLAFVANWQPAWPQQRTEGKPLVLKGATLIDGTGRPPIPDALVVIEGDRIKAVGGKEINYPPDATILDLSEKFIIPGLVDSHTHYQLWSGELYLNQGVTTIMFWSPVGANDITEEIVQSSQQSSTRTPRIFSRGGGLRLSPSMSREQVREMVRQWLKTNPDFAGLPAYSDSINKQAYQWLVEELHEAGLVTFGHTENAPASVKAGQDVVEHLWGFAKALMTPTELENFEKGEYFHWGLFFRDKARMDQMIKEAVQRGAYINPTFLYELGSETPLAHKHELEMYEVFREPALMTYYPENLADGILRKFRVIRNYSTKYADHVSTSHLNDKDWQEFKEAYRLTGEFVKRWVELGGKVLGGTDAPRIGTEGLTVHMEMAMLAEIGLTPMQALQAETLWGAEILTVRRKTPTTPPVGLVAKGAYADLVILTANPLDNIENTKKIERVMKGGQFVEFGYTPNYATSKPGQVTAVHNNLEPEISAISPHTVVEGSPEFEMVIEGEGFVEDSVIRVDGIPIPTTFVNMRTLRAKISGSVIAQATPDRFVMFGAEQRVGVYGDRTVKITVFNGPPDGGTSNSVSLRVIAKWLAEDQEVAK